MATVFNVHAGTKVSSGGFAGGLVGLQHAEDKGTASIAHASSSADVSGNFHTGGLVGFNQNDGAAAARIH